MNVEIRTVTAQFLFWEYLFRIFGIGSLQCTVIRFVSVSAKFGTCTVVSVNVTLVALKCGHSSMNVRKVQVQI
jgi:hypothetical protein